jgi:putative membrane protein
MADQRRVLLSEEPDAASGAPVPVGGRVELEPVHAPPVVLPEPFNAKGSEPLLDTRTKWMLKAGLLLGAGLLGVQTFMALASAFAQSLLLGGAWSALIGLLGSAAGRAGWRSYRRLQRVRAQQSLRDRATRLLAHQGITEGLAFCETLARDADIAATPEYAEWHRQLSATHNDREVLQLYERTVLRAQDARALDCVSRHAGDVTVMVAVSYFPAVDMLLVLWRQLGMVEEIARVYGVDPGYWGRIRLLRKVLRNVAFAGASEIAAEVGLEALGAGISARLSAAAAQGVAAGVLTARLGLRTMDACRAIPWSDAEPPRLRQVSGTVLENARRYLLEGRS